jgi:PIN domain nuclease of toxin-antitoxin system
MPCYVLDASALIADIYGEKGTAVVHPHLSKAMISCVNLTEVATRMADSGTPLDQVEENLKGIGVQIIPYDEELAFIAAALRAKTRAYGLSLADRACLALAMREKLPVLTADTAWKKLSVGVKITLIR